MDVKKTVEELLRRYGTPFVLEAEGAPRRGVLSPRQARGETDGRLTAEPLGRGVEGRYLLVAPASAAGLVKGARLTCGGERYFVEAAEPYLLAGEPLYRWAALVRCGERRGSDGGAGTAQA